MGLFSGKKRTYVSSTVYNLAGDVDKRPNFLKTAVMQAVVLEKDSIAKAVTDAYLTGPAIKLQNLTNWANNKGYTDELGLASGTINSGDSIDFITLVPELPSTPGSTVDVHSAEIDPGDFSAWADQYVSLNHPELLATEYVSDINKAGNLITITYVDTTTESFTPVNFDPRSRYLYVNYTESTGTVPGSIVTGTTISIGSGDPFPSTVGYNSVSSSSNTYNYDIATLKFAIITYSDGRPSEYTSTTTYTPGTYTTSSEVWEKTDYMGSLVGTDSTYSIKYIMHHDVGTSVEQSDNTVVTTEIIPTNVTKTTSTRTVITTIEPAKSHRTDTQDIILKSWGPLKVYIYKFESGNAVLDAMFATSTIGSQFLPVIPFRLNNQFISDTSPTVLYPLAKRALKKAIGAKYDDIETNIKDNANLGDIDYAYAVFGVSLNVKENACKKYIYKFFQTILEDPNQLESGSYVQYLLDFQAASASIAAWNVWRDAQENPVWPYTPPGPEPVKLPYPVMPLNKLNISSESTDINYNVELQWNFIDEALGSGLLIPTAKAGQLWLEQGPGYNQAFDYRAEDVTDNTFKKFSWTRNNYSLIINWQETDTTWRKLTIYGLTYRNSVYNGHYVSINIKQALEDPDESGFIIPLNASIYRSMGIKDKTQMATACCFMVFNSYQEVKQKWYQTSIFKVLLIVLVVVLTIIFPPAGAGAQAAAMATGTFLGFSGTIALVVGFVVNYVAAIIITKLIMQATTHVLGDKLGTIIGTILAIVTLQVAQGLIGGQGPLLSLNNMMQAPNLLKLTIPIGNSYATYINASSQDIIKQTENLMQDAEKKSKEIAEKYEEMFGGGSMIFDPKLLTERNAVLGESMDSFLQRTLMVGTDIVDISLNLLHNFTDITLSTDLKL